MNPRVLNLTEMAIGAMGFQIMDQNGFPVDSLHEIIAPQMNILTAAADPQPSSSQSPSEHFMAQYGIMDLESVMDDPYTYVERQMQALYRKLENRISKIKDKSYDEMTKEMREKYASEISEEVETLKLKVMAEYRKEIVAIETAVGADFSQTDDEIDAAYKAKALEMIEEFNMLLQLQKFMIDDMPDDRRDLELLLQCLKTTKTDDFEDTDSEDQDDEQEFASFSE